MFVINSRVNKLIIIEPLHQLNLLQVPVLSFAKPSVGGVISAPASWKEYLLMDDDNQLFRFAEIFGICLFDRNSTFVGNHKFDKQLNNPSDDEDNVSASFFFSTSHLIVKHIFKLLLEASVGWSAGVSVCISVENISR